MDKTDARKEAIRMWRSLPPNEHRHHKQATAFAKLIAPTLEFETLGDHDKIIEGWLQRDLIETEEAARKFSQKLKSAPPAVHRRQPTPAK